MKHKLSPRRRSSLSFSVLLYESPRRRSQQYQRQIVVLEVIVFATTCWSTTPWSHEDRHERRLYQKFERAFQQAAHEAEVIVANQQAYKGHRVHIHHVVRPTSSRQPSVWKIAPIVQVARCPWTGAMARYGWVGIYADTEDRPLVSFRAKG